MSIGLNQIKPVVLTFAMLIAVALNCSRASAPDIQNHETCDHDQILGFL